MIKAVTNEHDKEIPKERYMFPEEKQEIADELRLIMEYQKTTKVSKNSQKK